MIRPIKRYHPERHYMRGPGPKWLEKRGIGVDRVDAVMDDRRPHKRLPTNMIRTAIISVIASSALIGVVTADLVSYHPAMDVNPLTSPARLWHRAG
jgi:hypothetical protein